MLLKDIIILAGPNGAGKTTAAPVLLPQELGIREFVNADEIARGLSPFNAEGAALAAGRFMIERMRYLVRNEQSFALETTCSGRAHASWLRECRAKNWRVTLLFLWLPSPQAALDRVAWRVAAIYENSDEGRTLIAERTPDASLVVHDPMRWAMIERAR